MEWFEPDPRPDVRSPDKIENYCLYPFQHVANFLYDIRFKGYRYDVPLKINYVTRNARYIFRNPEAISSDGLHFITDVSFDSKLIEKLEGYEHLGSIELLMKKEEGKDIEYPVLTNGLVTFVVLPRVLKESTYILLAGCINRLMPWLFESGEKYTGTNNAPAEFVRLIQMMSKKDNNAALTFMNEKAAPYREVRKNNNLKAIFSNKHQNEIKEWQKKLAQYEREIESHIENIRLRAIDIENAKIQIAGMQSLSRSDKSFDDFKEFMSTQNVEILDVGQDNIRLRIYGFFDNYDAEWAEPTIRNPESYLYSIGDSFENMYDAVFLKERYKMAAFSEYNISFNNYRVTSLLYQGVDSKDGHDWLPNPHMTHYTCFGGYEISLIEALREFDLIEVISLLTAATQNLGFVDSSMMHFCQSLHDNRSSKILYCKEDKQWYSVDEVLRRESNE